MPKAFYKFNSVGKRKTAIARIFMKEGKGEFVINDKPIEEYFPTSLQQMKVKRSLQFVNMADKFNVKVRVAGGGVNSQAEAVQHGLSRALLLFDPELRAKLKPEGFLTRDSREKERKKYGQPGARRKFQYSKR